MKQFYFGVLVSEAPKYVYKEQYVFTVFCYGVLS